MEVLIAEFEETDPFTVADIEQNENSNNDNDADEGSESSYKDYEAAVIYLIFRLVHSLYFETYTLSFWNLFFRV